MNLEERLADIRLAMRSERPFFMSAAAEAADKRAARRKIQDVNTCRICGQKRTDLDKTGICWPCFKKGHR